MRFYLVIDTAGGWWTVTFTDDWGEVLTVAALWGDRRMYVTDHEYGLNYHFRENEWTKVGFSPRCRNIK